MKAGTLILVLGLLTGNLFSQPTDSTIISRSPYDVNDSLMFGFVPSYHHDSIPAYSGTSIFTTEYQPSGSQFHEQCNEEDVYLSRLTHKEGDSILWDLRIGQAGTIYSFIGPYGEGVPPQWRSWDFNTARWVDDLWQIVALSSDLHNADEIPAPPGSTLGRPQIPSMRYFIHGGGVYMNDTLFARTNKPFYSPLMASWYNKEEKAFYTSNWGTQAHIPSIHKAHLLYTYKYKDLGNGIMENTMIMQNFGDHRVNYLNMPWGGVRAQNLPQSWLSKPDHSLERKYEQFGGTDPGLLNDIDESGGYFIWAADGEDENRPAMALVFGKDRHYDELKSAYNMLPTRIRWGGVGLVTDRNYLVFTVNPRLDINPGTTFFYRVFYINGTMKEVHELAKKIAGATDYGFIQTEPGLLPQTLIKPADHFNAFKEDIKLFAQPPIKMVPLFLLENTVTGNRYISPDLFHDVPTLPFTNPYEPTDPKYETYQNRIVYRPYDGTIKYIRLLGYGLEKGSSTANFRWALLDTLITDPTKLIFPAAYRNRIWIPVEPCDTCKVEPEPVPETGFMLYNDFAGNQEIPWTGPVNLKFSDHIPNPDTSDANPSFTVGQAVRDSGIWAHVHFDMPQYLDLTAHNTFKVKAYYEGTEPVPAVAKVRLILRNNGEGTTQYSVEKNVTVANTWQEYSFPCPTAQDRNDYNQVWLFFSSPDNDDIARGHTYYVDDLMGPPLTIKAEDYNIRTNTSGDSIIMDFSRHGQPLSLLSEPVFNLFRSGTEQITIGQVSNDSSFIYLHPEQGTAITGRDELTLSFVSGVVKDGNGFILPYFSGTPVENLVQVAAWYLRFLVSDAETAQKLSGISVRVDTSEQISGATGELLFETDTGYHSYHVSGPNYYALDSGLVLVSDTVLEISLIKDATWVQDIYSDGISIYPNPAGKTLTVESDRQIREISVYSMYGKLLSRHPMQDRLHNMNVSDLHQGVYILEILQSESSPIFRRLVISR